MSTWLKADIDFGVPWQTYTLNLRSVLGLKFYRDFVGSSQDPQVLATAAAKAVTEVYPELAGLIVASVSVDPMRNRWIFTILHPSLPRVKMAEMPEAIRLERCPGCGKPLPNMAEWLALDGLGNPATYCSRQCHESDEVVIR